MLAGRAFMYKLFSLTHYEIGEDFNLDHTLNYGSLAKVFEYQTHREKATFLKSYVEAYIKEEVLIEQLIRSLPPFRKFLEISATQDTDLVNYSNIAKDINSNHKTILNYYSILEDTLLGFFLEPYHTSIRKRQKQSPKFYWFDTGVRRALSQTIDLQITPKSFEYGSLFESFIVNEIYRLLTYSEKSFKLSFLRIDEKLEIDLIIERAGLPTFLIEIKSTDYIHENHTATLENFAKKIKNSIPMVLSNDKESKKIGNVLCLHWQLGIKEIDISFPE